MKKQLFAALSACCFTLSASATVLTVSNNTYSPGQYTNVQDACNAAAANDTIYIHGSPTNYGGFTVTKPLVIFGAGALPDKNYAWPTTTGEIWFGFNQTGTSSGSGSKIYGCRTGTIYLNGTGSIGDAGVNNIVIRRNYIAGISFQYFAHSNIHIQNNIIHGSVASNANANLNNVQIRNNIISNNISGLGANPSGPSIAHNIIYGGISACSSASIFNNIFYGGGNALALEGSSQNNYCTITNNCLISANTTYTPGIVVYGTNTGGDNLLNVDPLFMDDGTLAEVSVWNYSYTSPGENGPFADYHLQASSPCIGAGIGGEDLGIYGGVTPYFEGIPNDGRFRYYPMPNIPAMRDMSIENSNILPDGTLNVEFKARKQN